MSSGFTLRNATVDDLDDVTEIHKVSFIEEPEQNYRFPYRDQYPQDYSKWTRKEYENYLKQPLKFVFHVVDSLVEQEEGKKTVRPVALAVWDVSVGTKAKYTDIGIGERQDANKKHCQAFAEASKQRPEKCFGTFGEEQIYLSILITHPDFRRKGVGTLLTNRGFNSADEKCWPVTVCASPMGRLLYERLGFEKIATEVVQVEGEEEVLETTIMVRKNRLEAKHSSAKSE